MNGRPSPPEVLRDEGDDATTGCWIPVGPRRGPPWPSSATPLPPSRPSVVRKE